MSSVDEQFVPKVHPATRMVEAEDPMLLVGSEAAGDPNVMLDCMIQEFSWMGFDPEQLLQMFRSPVYPVLHQLLEQFGEQGVRRRLDELFGQTGTPRFAAFVDDEPPPEDDEPQLIQIAMPGVAKGS